MRLVTSVLLLSASLSIGAARAAVCDITGAPAPDVATMTSSAVSSTIVIVRPDCTSDAVGAINRGQMYEVRSSTLERIAKAPGLAATFSVTAPLSRGADLTAANSAREVTISSVSTSASAKTFAFPSTLQTLTLSSTGIADFELLAIPSAVETLTIKENKQLKSLARISLPSSLRMLDLSNNQLTAIDFALPSKLWRLVVTGNPITKLDGVVFPDSLEGIYCGACSITSMRGVKLPSSLYFLDLGYTFKTFEIRKSDVVILRRLTGTQGSFQTVIEQPTCADKTAEVVTVGQSNVCVISDERFNEVYAGGPPTSPSGTAGSAPSPASPSSPATPGTSTGPARKPGTSPLNATGVSGGSSTSTGAGSLTGTSGGGGAGSTTATGGGTAGGGESLTAQGGGSSTAETEATSTAESGGVSGTTSTNSRRTSSPNAKAGSKNGATDNTTTKSSSSASNTTIIVAAIGGAVLLLVMGAIGYRVMFFAKDKSHHDTTGTYTSMKTPQTTTYSGGSRELSNEYLENDIRNDKALSLYRIDGSAIQLGDAIARGGFGVIYRGVFDGQRVAIKQMLPSTCRDEAKVRNFMDEIRLCVRLDHPKIVRCVGISWTSLRDLSVVIEYMDGGDLHSVLHNQMSEPTGREWSECWTDSQIKSKTAIASDIAEAIVYLHSFNGPIIHRDLKAKNVLLDSTGIAKLSDFGISREVPMDETMTREVGTVAWIAPEVLRGERYSEMADIYSLGVLLVELDRCCHPYSHEDILAAAAETDSRGRRRARAGAASQAMLKNTRIAILVSTGKLRPTVSASCPDGIRQLVDRCLAADSSLRPNAMEVHHGLRLFWRGLVKG